MTTPPTNARPDDPLATDPDLGLRFDVTADDYHRLRPRYPTHIVDALIDGANLIPGNRVLEIGAGTGIATRPLAERGLAITALEPGPAMAAIAWRELAGFPNVTVIDSAFEAWTPPAGTPPFDLVLAATAFHWLDRQTRLDRIAALLRPGGTLAILGYAHAAGGDEAFFAKAQECYLRWMPGASPDETLPAWNEPPDTSEIDDHPAFQLAGVQQWREIVPSTRQDYLDLLGTYSGHIVLDAERRAGLLGCLGDLIDREFSGRIAKAYRYELILARRT
ncbi:MAG: methyltransferase domain-containing protein [Thermomicrobiales bacterium]